MTTAPFHPVGDAHAVIALRQIDVALAAVSGRSIIDSTEVQSTLLDLRQLIAPLADHDLAAKASTPIADTLIDPEPTTLALDELVVMADEPPVEDSPWAG